MKKTILLLSNSSERASVNNIKALLYDIIHTTFFMLDMQHLYNKNKKEGKDPIEFPTKM